MADIVAHEHKNYDENLVFMGSTGAARYMPLTANAPAANMGAYPAEAVILGWIEESGVVETLEQEFAEVKPFNANGTILSRCTKEEVTFKVGFLSSTGIAAALHYNVPESEMSFDDSSGVVTFKKGAELPKPMKFRLGIDVLDGDKARRFFLPNAEITAREDLNFKKGEPVKYGFTIKATIDRKLGYAIQREIKEGWQPGKVGTKNEGTSGVRDAGAWHEEIDG
ncbi:hypothetical protein [Corynebacterium aquilae]|uniref:hypothetical protein n=1 Tax=Corynebacterium aquilae TaxID=203263 RepID=UPI00095326F3|nr:hypothetical protein [Corynebacterium aquilae]